MSLTFTHIALRPLGAPPVGQDWPVLGFRPDSSSYDEGAEVKTYMERNDEGVNVPTDLVLGSRMPKITLGVQRSNADFISVQLARALVTGASSGTYAFDKVVESGTVVAAVSGFVGFGAVADDANSIGAISKNGRFAPMTRDAFAGFAPATAGDRFALGANAALKFSDTVVGNRALVLIPYPTTDSHSLGVTRGQFELRASAVLDELGSRRMVNLTSSRVAVNVQESGQIESGADSYSLVLVDLSGTCAAQIAFHRAQGKC
jgi:hypothetical protein